jgi:hypothetical protein
VGDRVRGKALAPVLADVIEASPPATPSAMEG